MVQQNMATRADGAMSDITLWYNFQGHPENVCFMQFSQNMEGFRFHKMSHRAFRIPATL